MIDRFRVRRRQPRTEVSRPAVAYFGSDHYPCTLTNLSRGGACLAFASDPPTGDRLHLLLNASEPLRSCQVVWRSGAKLGLRFVD